MREPARTACLISGVALSTSFSILAIVPVETSAIFANSSRVLTDSGFGKFAKMFAPLSVDNSSTVIRSFRADVWILQSAGARQSPACCEVTTEAESHENFFLFKGGIFKAQQSSSFIKFKNRFFQVLRQVFAGLLASD